MKPIKDGRKKELYKLLDERNADPDKKQEIDRKIIQEFEKSVAIMMTDSVGFSHKTRTYGIIQYLAVLKKINDELEKIIEKYDGRLLKEWADNFIIVFESPVNAVKAAIDMNCYIKRYNQTAASDEKFGICIGIGYGPVLYTGDDYFGDEVNITSLLGEDVANDCEILITEGAYDYLKEHTDLIMTYVKELKISGIPLKYYSVKY
jgi:adenylate cyclase